MFQHLVLSDEDEKDEDLNIPDLTDADDAPAKVARNTVPYYQSGKVPDVLSAKLFT